MTVSQETTIGVPGGTGQTLGSLPNVLYVPTAPSERSGVREKLARARIRCAADLPDAMGTMSSNDVTLCLVDLAGGRAALAGIRLIRSEHPRMAIVGVADPAEPVTAAQGMHAGLSDVLPWPFEERDLVEVALNARGRAAVNIESAPDTDAVVAHSDAMREALAVAATVAERHGGVSVFGERGSGRELIARAIHRLNPDEEPRPFVVVDCAGESPEDVELRLFGIAEKLSSRSRKTDAGELVGRGGAVVSARGGTLYLRNVLDAPARVQAKLARLLRDREATLVEDRRGLIDLDVRPIAGTSTDVEAAAEDGRLRPDLYERVSAARIQVPPLRDRREDIPALAVRFASDACRHAGVETKVFSRSALVLMAALPWHGNAAEMRTLVSTLVNSVRHSVIQLDDLLEHARLDGMSARIEAGLTLREAKARFEKECISTALRQHHGRVGEAAKALGIQRTNLYRKVRQLNVARSLLSARR